MCVCVCVCVCVFVVAFVVTLQYSYRHSSSILPPGGAANAEVKVLSVQNPELTNCVLLLKSGVSQNDIATHASPGAMNFFLVLISTFPVHSPAFFSKFSLYFLTALVLANVFSCVGPR